MWEEEVEEEEVEEDEVEEEGLRPVCLSVCRSVRALEPRSAMSIVHQK